MNPLRIRARNYRTFGELDVALPDGCVAVLGENGAGKSSIVNVIDYALFGAESRSLAELLTDDGVATELEIELTFEHAGALYRVRRGYSAKGRGKTTVDLEEQRDTHNGLGNDTGPQWFPLTCESARETDALICRTIGLTRATFRASAFLAQGDGAAFTDCPPAKRKEVLAEVLGLDIWTTLQERAKTDRRAAEAELQRLAGETAQARTLVDGKRAVELDRDVHRNRAADLERAIASDESQITDLEQRYRTAAEAAGKRATLDAELDLARAELEQLQRADVAATEAATAITVARDELETLTTPTQTDQLIERERELVAAVDDHTRQSHERDLLLREHDRLSKQRDDTLLLAEQTDGLAGQARAKIAETREQSDATCETCGQHLAGDAKDKAVAAYTEELQRHADTAKRLRDEAAAIVLPTVPPGLPPAPIVELADVRAQLQRVQAQVQQRARLEERIVQLQKTVDARPAQNTIADATEKTLKIGSDLDELEPVDLDAIKDAGTRVRATLTRAREEHQQVSAALARIEERLAQITTAEQQLAAGEQRTRELQAEVDLCASLEKAYGRDGIPALVIENSAIPSIETEAARILAELGGSTASCRVELRTLAERKTADGLRDTLDVIIVGEQGERAYETFSGGERTRINLALRIALARLLAHRRGAESRLLAIDEPEFLDEQGTGALVDVLRGLAGDFDRVYLISHVPSLRDSFDDVITVVKDGDRSRVEHGGGEGGVPSAVAA